MDFERLVLQAAIDSAGSRRANSYARVDAVVDARAPALGKSYESYLAGEYWAREWVKQGARRDKMVSEFPAVLLESRRTELPDGLEVNNARIHYRLYVLHKIQCDECKVKPTPVSPLLFVYTMRPVWS